MTIHFSTADLGLARRMEKAEAATGFALARAARPGEIEAEAIAGGCALFGGVGSPMTHALGIGMDGDVDDCEFDRMEEFFRARGSASLLDLCPMASMSVIEKVIRRGYKVIEFNNLMLRRIEPADAEFTAAGVGITSVGPDRHREWCRTLVEGFCGTTDVPPEMVELMERFPSAGENLFAESDGAPAGTAAMSMQEGVAHLYGDATLPHARGRGLQATLIRHRLALAARAGCEWAMACVLPGSGSHRNYERCGFGLFYMRVNVMRELS